jgi:hypothetical protein
MVDSYPHDSHGGSNYNSMSSQSYYTGTCHVCGFYGNANKFPSKALRGFWNYIFRQTGKICPNCASSEISWTKRYE